MNAAPKTDPISGLPIKAPGTPTTSVTSNIPMPITMDTSPKATGVTSNIPMPIGTKAPAPKYANPWDDPNYQEPIPPPASTYAGQGAAMTAAEQQAEKDKAIQAKNGQNQAAAMATADTKKTGPAYGTTTAPTGTDIANPNNTKPEVSTTPPSAFETTLTKFQDILSKWADGMPDAQYKNALNQIITNSALMNSAEKDALQIQINQDPNLRGQGAGLAMMQVLARDHNFNLDQALAKASGDSLDRIISMQKYGIEQGTQIATDLRNAKLEDAKIALEAAATARTNAKEDINTLTSSGQFDAAAAAMNDYMKTAFPGLNLNITAASLKSRDPQELTKMTQKLNFIKDLAGTNPNAALPLIKSLMADPAFDGYFADGMSAEDVLASLSTGQASENATQAGTINTQINAIALPGADGKLQSFDETGNLYPNLFKLQGRDAVKEGKKLDVADINAIRATDGLPAFSKDSQGNIVDENGVPLDDQDYTELAYRKDFYDKQQAAKTKPWEQMRNQILDSPMGKYFTDEKLYPGANDTLNKLLAANSLGVDLFVNDASGNMVPNAAAMGQLLNNPSLWPLIHNWPSAVFTADGSVAKDVAGKDISTPGGYVYGDKGPDGQPVLSTADDQVLDSAYFAYRNSGGTLDPTQWYYATAGGKVQPDPTKVPAGLKVGEDFSKVGDPSVPTPTPTPTTPIPNPKADPFTQLISDRLSLADPAKADSVVQAGTVYRDTYKDSPINTVRRLSEGSDEQFQAGVDALKAKGLTDDQISKFVDHSSNKGSLDDIFNTNSKAYSKWNGTPAFAYYSLYQYFMKSGLAQSDAFQALKNLVGEENADGALELEQLAGGSKNTVTLYR